MPTRYSPSGSAPTRQANTSKHVSAVRQRVKLPMLPSVKHARLTRPPDGDSCWEASSPGFAGGLEPICGWNTPGPWKMCSLMKTSSRLPARPHYALLYSASTWRNLTNTEHSKSNLSTSSQQSRSAYFRLVGHVMQWSCSSNVQPCLTAVHLWVIASRQRQLFLTETGWRCGLLRGEHLHCPIKDTTWSNSLCRATLYARWNEGQQGGRGQDHSERKDTALLCSV